MISMNKHLHKTLALLLSLCLVLSLLPAMALADSLPTPTGLALRAGGHHDLTRPCLHWTNEYYSYEVELYEANHSSDPSNIISGSGASQDVPLYSWWILPSGAATLSQSYEKAVLRFKDSNGNKGPAAELPISLTINQELSEEAYTATYKGVAQDQYSTTTFEVSGLPADTSVDFNYIDASGQPHGIISTSAGSGGVSEIKDTYANDQWSYGLGDMTIAPGDTYYVDIVTTNFVLPNTAVTTITRHPLNIVFDQRPEQTMSWSGGSGSLPAVYGDGSAGGKTASTNADGGAIAYSSSDSAVAEVNASSGALTIKGAGSATITATAAENTNYRATSISYTLTVAKKAITVAAENKNRPYGQTNPALTFSHTPGDLAVGDAVADLAVTLSCQATATSPAGTDVAITGTSASPNYNVTVTPGWLTITKADPPQVSSVTKSLYYDSPYSGITANIARQLPSDRGTATFSPGIATGDIGILDGNVETTDTGISFNTTAGSAGQTVTIPVTVTMQNYADVVVNVIVSLLDKIPVEITGVTVDDKVYDGLPIDYAGAPANQQGYSNDAEDAYEYLWSSPDGSAPKDVGSHSLTVKIPDNNPTHMGELTLDFTISPKELTAKPKDISIYRGQPLPTSFELEYLGIVSGDSIIPAGGSPAFALVNSGNPLEDSNTKGSYTIQWTNKDSLTVQHINYSVTKADGTLTISSGGGGSYDDGGSVTPAPGPAAPAVPIASTSGNTATVAATAAAVVNAAGTAVAEVSASSMAGLIESAKSSEKDNKNTTIEIKVTAPASAKDSQLAIPKASLETIAKETGADLRIATNTAVLTFDSQAIAAISSGAASGNVQFSIRTVNPASLPETVQLQAAGRPVFDFSVTAGSSQISDFKGGSVGVSLPYTPAAGEDTNAIVIYYISGSGQLETVTNGVYDAKTGTVLFTTGHFSSYAIGYNKVSFKDVAPGAWYESAVSFVAARGITYGIGGGSFGPDTALTRGEFIVMLMRAYGISADVNPTDNFADAGSTFYTGYLGAAKRLGISGGVGDNKFLPGKAITRQEMFALLHNTLKAIGQLPQGDSGKTLADFSDASQIDAWAQDAMTLLVKAGIVGGSSGKLDPTGGSTRAQMAQVLHNLLSR